LVQLVAGDGTAIAGPLLSSAKGPGRKYNYRHRMGMVPSAEFNVFHDDFHSFMVSTAITNGPAANVPLNGWANAVIDTGATIVADTTVGNHTGALLFDSDGTSEGAALYTTESFQIVSGKRFFIETRVKLEVADDCDFQFGFSDVTASTNPEDLWTTAAANLVTFGVLDGGSAYPTMLADKSNSGTSAQAQTLKTIANDTWTILAIGYDGSNLTGHLNGEQVLLWSTALSTSLPTGVTLALFFGYRNGSAATNEAQVDYIRVVQER